MLWTQHGSIMVLVHANHPPSDDDWDRYLHELKVQMEHHALGAILVDSRGEGPNATQRRKLGALAERAEYIPTAIVTTNVIARGIMRALSWFRQDTFRAFDSLASAHAWLGIGDLQVLEGLVFSMRARMP